MQPGAGHQGRLRARGYARPTQANLRPRHVRPAKAVCATRRPSSASPAATVIILRDTEAGPEVLMLKRSGRAGFFPNAWVFPGGRVDEADGATQTRGDALGLHANDRAFGVAAIRETFEEAGITGTLCAQ